MAFLNADLRPGIEIVTQAAGLEEVVADADLVITGEGRIDSQTIHGKTPIGGARVAAIRHSGDRHCRRIDGGCRCGPRLWYRCRVQRAVQHLFRQSLARRRRQCTHGRPQYCRHTENGAKHEAVVLCISSLECGYPRVFAYSSLMKQPIFGFSLSGEQHVQYS